MGADHIFGPKIRIRKDLGAAVSPDYGNCSGYGLDLHFIGTFTQPFLISESGIVVSCCWMECRMGPVDGTGLWVFFFN